MEQTETLENKVGSDIVSMMSKEPKFKEIIDLIKSKGFDEDVQSKVYVETVSAGLSGVKAEDYLESLKKELSRYASFSGELVTMAPQMIPIIARDVLMSYLKK